MQLFQKGIIDSVKPSFRRWRRNGPQIENSPYDSDAFFGRTVQISGDGTVVAAWITSRTTTDSPGAVKVYKIAYNGTWTQIGQTIQSESGAGVNFGRAIALNYDGTRMAISAPRWLPNNITGRVTVYDLVNSTWTLIGTFYGEWLYQNEATTRYPFGMSFNTTGSRLAMFLGYNPSGVKYIKVYDYDGTNWNQIGQTVLEASELPSAFLNGAGNILATSENVWSLQSGTWVQIGYFPSSTVGSVVWTAEGAVLNESGLILALRYSVNYTTLFIKENAIKVFEYANGLWTQKGSTLSSGSWALNNGTLGGTLFQDLSASGNRLLAQGNYVAQGQNTVTSLVKVWDFAGGNWVQQTQPLIGNSATASAALSDNGKTFVYGKPSETPKTYAAGGQGVIDVFRKELD